MKGKLIVVLVTMISMFGCTTMRQMDARRGGLQTQLEFNDHLVIYESSGRIIDMTFIEIDNARIRGRLTDGSQGPISVDLDDIEKMEIEKIDGVKTTLAVVGGTVIILPLALIAVLVGGMSS